SNGNVDVFGIGSNQGVLYRSQSYAGWSGWNNIGGVVTAISAKLDADGTVGVFAIAPDNSVWYEVQSPAGRWSSDWMNSGGGVIAISAVQDPAGNLGCVAIAPGGSVWYDERAKYSRVANGRLVNPKTNNLPSDLDVQQTRLGDCWLMASLAEVAARNPQAIKDMIKFSYADFGSGISYYRVRFYDDRGVDYYFTVDDQLPAGGGLYDRPV